MEVCCFLGAFAKREIDVWVPGFGTWHTSHTQNHTPVYTFQGEHEEHLVAMWNPMSISLVFALVPDMSCLTEAPEICVNPE